MRRQSIIVRCSNKQANREEEGQCLQVGRKICGLKVRDGRGVRCQGRRNGVREGQNTCIVLGGKGYSELALGEVAQRYVMGEGPC